MAQSIAVLGTGSDVGKTLVASGICRILKNHGVKVAPFKAQNMSNNAQPALISNSDNKLMNDDPNHDEQRLSWGEIGTAQAMQAEACQILPRVEMNPILLKSGGRRASDGAYLCNVIILGKSFAVEDYGQLGRRTTTLMDIVLQSHTNLIQLTQSDVIVIEGAGSCTELNLMQRDIVNIPLVRKLNCPWILVANIDPGGVFAQIVGTKACLSDDDWDLCVGIIVNQLKGDVKYFEPGPKMIQDMVGKPVFVVPYLYGLKVPEEDGLGVERRLQQELEQQQHSAPDSTDSDAGNEKKKERIIVVSYPHIAITSDITPIENDNRFIVEWKRYNIPKETYPTISCLILPGSRLTRSDLEWMKNDTKWVSYIQNFVKLGGRVIGICGGYQMLGLNVIDSKGVEGSPGISKGLGLLPIETEIEPAECKIVTPRKGVLVSDDDSIVEVDGFELHCGRSKVVLNDEGEDILSTTTITSSKQPKSLIQFTDLDSKSHLAEEEYDGLQVANIFGTYIHGIFKSKAIRGKILLGNRSNKHYESSNSKDDEDDPLNIFADHLESCGLTYDTLNGFLSLQHVVK